MFEKFIFLLLKNSFIGVKKRKKVSKKLVRYPFNHSNFRTLSKKNKIIKWRLLQTKKILSKEENLRGNSKNKLSTAVFFSIKKGGNKNIKKAIKQDFKYPISRLIKFLNNSKSEEAVQLIKKQVDYYYK